MPAGGQVSLFERPDSPVLGWGRHICGARKVAGLQGWDRVAVEHPVLGPGGREVARLDIALLRGERVVMGIEVCASHPVPQDKRLKLAWLGVPWVEVDVSGEPWWTDWSLEAALPVARSCHRLRFRCEDHRRTSAVELVRFVDLYVRPGVVEKPCRLRMPVFLSAEYTAEGLAARVLSALLGRHRILGAVEGDWGADEPMLQDALREVFQQGLTAFEGLLPQVEVDVEAPWVPLAELEPKGRWLEGVRLAHDTVRYPFRRRWDSDSEGWVVAEVLPVVPVEGPASEEGAAGDEAGRMAELLKEVEGLPDEDARFAVAAFAAYAVGQAESVYQRKPTASGLPPRWGADDAKALEAWEHARMMSEGMARLIDCDEAFLGEAREADSAEEIDEMRAAALSWLGEEAGVEWAMWPSGPFGELMAGLARLAVERARGELGG